MAATGSPSARPMPCCASGSRPVVGVEEAPLADAAGRCLAATSGEPARRARLRQCRRRRLRLRLPARHARGRRAADAAAGPGRGRPSVLGRAARRRRLARADRCGDAGRAPTPWRCRRRPTAEGGTVDHPARAQGRRQPAPGRRGRARRPARARDGHRDCARRRSASRPSWACGTLPVFARLRVALLSTGDELDRARPAASLPAASTTPTARSSQALLRSLPVEVTDLGIAPDDAGEVRRILAAAAATHDVLLTSGGASRGDEDHVVRTRASRTAGSISGRSR